MCFRFYFSFDGCAKGVFFCLVRIRARQNLPAWNDAKLNEKLLEIEPYILLERLKCSRRFSDLCMNKQTVKNKVEKKKQQRNFRDPTKRFLCSFNEKVKNSPWAWDFLAMFHFNSLSLTLYFGVSMVLHILTEYRGQSSY